MAGARAVAAMAAIAPPQLLRSPAIGSGGGGRSARAKVICSMSPQRNAWAETGESEWDGAKVTAKMLMPLLAAALVGQLKQLSLSFHDKSVNLLLHCPVQITRFSVPRIVAE